MTADAPFETLLVRDTGRVRIITLNRPQVRNALNMCMKSELAAALAAADGGPAIGAVVLTGAGGAFCAGADIRDLAPETGEAYRRRLRELQVGLIERIVRSEKVFVAAVDGPAVGGGFGLAAACDIIVASETAYFRATQVHMLGVSADLGLAATLPLVVGHVRASALLHLGMQLSAPEAREWGLVLDVVRSDAVLATAVEAAQRCAAGAPLAQAATKRLLGVQRVATVSAQLEAEASSQALLRLTRDHAEGSSAFRDRRPPQFTGE